MRGNRVLIEAGVLTRRRQDRYDLAPFSLHLEHGFAIPLGQHVVLVGPNGSGKSTLLAAMAGIPSDLRRCSAAFWLELDGRRDSLGRRSSYLAAEPEYFPTVTVRTYLELLRFSYPIASEDIERALDWAALPRSLWNRAPHTLSSGQRKRLGVSRLLLQDDPVVLLDEPLDHLDTEGRRLVGFFIQRAVKDGRTVIVASHDPSDLAQAHRVLEIRLEGTPNKGSLQDNGTTTEDSRGECA